jgi:hypothetical protein
VEKGGERGAEKESILEGCGSPRTLNAEEGCGQYERMENEGG